jgi:hypothetical protein
MNSAGYEKQHCTIMPAVTVDGQELSPYVLFEHKRMAKEKFPEGIIVQVWESSWMTEDVIDDRINSVWF